MNFLQAANEHLGLAAPSWAAWRAVIGGALACPLDDEQRATFRRVFHRDPPTAPVRELWLAAGRRAGKDYAAVRLAAYLALFNRWHLSPGEVGTALLLAVDRAQARVAFQYLRGCLEADPALWAEVAATTADTITFRSGVEVSIVTADHAAVRGRTVLAAILDELAFWAPTDATEVLRALRPAMATQPRSMLVAISSAYSARGTFFEAFRRHYGVDDPRVLFGKAATVDLNPTIDHAFIADELARDPAAAAAEFLSEFRSDIESFLDAGLIDAATRASPREVAYSATTRTGGPTHYWAGIDASGGRGDAAAAAIATRDGDRVVVVATRRWTSPHDPLVVAREAAAFLRTYGLSTAIADSYAAGFATSTYREAGVALMPADVTRSAAYLHMLPLLTTGRFEIPDDPILRQELLALERRTGSSGKDSVDHPPHGHDDVANAMALAAYAASRTAAPQEISIHVEPLQVLRGYQYGTGDFTGGDLSRSGVLGGFVE